MVKTDDRPRVTAAGRRKARALFEDRAHDWLVRLGRAMTLPGDEELILRLAVPCRDCGAEVTSRRAGHRVVFEVPGPGSGRHWASGIVASCR